MARSLRLLPALCCLMASSTSATVVHVSAGADCSRGCDGSAGAPFPHLTHARDLLRSRRPGQKRAAPATVHVRGTHFLDSTFKLDSRDSGTASAPVTYKAWPADAPQSPPPQPGAHLSGGVRINPSAFQAVAVPSGAKGAVRVDLLAAGLNRSDFGSLASPYPKSKMELFFRGKPMTLARSPNIADDALATWEWAGYDNMTALNNVSFGFADKERGALWASALSSNASTLWVSEACCCFNVSN
jgi:hypothetical protein